MSVDPCDETLILVVSSALFLLLRGTSCFLLLDGCRTNSSDSHIATAKQLCPSAGFLFLYHCFIVLYFFPIVSFGNKLLANLCNFYVPCSSFCNVNQKLNCNLWNGIRLNFLRRYDYFYFSWELKMNSVRKSELVVLVLLLHNGCQEYYLHRHETRESSGMMDKRPLTFLNVSECLL